MNNALARFSILTCFFLAATFSSMKVVRPQSAAGQTGGAAISGHVTVAGKGVAGVTIVLVNVPVDMQKAILRMVSEGMGGARATTDIDGSYQFSGVAPGHYMVYAFTPTYASKGGPGNATDVTVNDGDAVGGIDFALERGGVITGKVTRADGRPVIGASVYAARDNGSPDSSQYSVLGMTGRPRTTDDRGVYRLYGLAAGKYTIRVVPPDSAQALTSGQGVVVYYPGVTDAGNAGKVDVNAGAETAGIDIKVTDHRESTYRASGRVVDESGNPVPAAIVLYGPVSPDEKSFSPAGGRVSTDSAGEFHIQGLTDGSYKASIYGGLEQEPSGYSEAVPFDVKDADASGIEIRLRQGGTVSGIVTLDGTADEEAAAKLSQQQVSAMVVSSSVGGAGFSHSQIAADGSFTLRGLPPGEIQISLGNLFEFGSSNPFKVIRIEQDGAPVTGGVKLEESQHLSGIRVVVAYANCSISGSVSVQGGKLPPGTGVEVVAVPARSDGSDNSVVFEGGAGTFFGGQDVVQVDASGQFQITGLAPGSYTVTIHLSGPAWSDPTKTPEASKAVMVTSGSDTRVDLTLDLSSNARDKN